jgi:hypothetical protein
MGWRHLTRPYREDTDILGAEEAVRGGAQGESRGHQYATCNDTVGWQIHEPSHPWMDGTLVQHSKPPPVNNIPRWTSLTAKYQGVDIPIAEATSLRKHLWLTSLNCGSLSEANNQNQINKAKLLSICCQFQRCGSDVMYLTDTRLTQVQGQKALEFMGTLLPHGTFLRKSAVCTPHAPQSNTQKKHWSKGTQVLSGGATEATKPSNPGQIGGMILIARHK